MAQKHTERYGHHVTFTHLGRRSWFLLLYAIAYLGIGYAVLNQSPTHRDLFVFDYLPTWIRSGIWVLAGVIAAFTAIVSPKPSTWQIWGFVGLAIPVSVRTVFYAAGLIGSIWDIPNRQMLISSGTSGIVIYGIMTVTILLVAGWPESGTADYLSICHTGEDDRDVRRFNSS